MRSLLLSLIVVFVTSCSGIAPEIFFIEHSLTIFRRQDIKASEKTEHHETSTGVLPNRDFLDHSKEVSSKEVGEYLSISLLADDQDSFGEIQQLYVIHDESELFWLISKEEWYLESRDENDYIIAHELHRQDFAPLPRGIYRILLLDYSGFRDEERIVIDEVFSTQELGEFIPLLSFEQNTLSIKRDSASQFDSGKNEVILSIIPLHTNNPGDIHIDIAQMTSGHIPRIITLNQSNEARIGFFPQPSTMHQIIAYFRYSDTIVFRSLPLLYSDTKDNKKDS